MMSVVAINMVMGSLGKSSIFVHQVMPRLPIYIISGCILKKGEESNLAPALTM